MFFCVISLLLVSLLYSVLFYFDAQDVIRLTAEDGLIESGAAIFFLATSVIFILLFFKDLRGNNFGVFRTGKNIFYLMLGVIFLLAFGEEISWGQRLLGYNAPEVFLHHNVQQEVNIHNLKLFHGLNEAGQRKSFWKLLLNIDRLFSLFWLTFCLLIPMLSLFRNKFSRWINQTGVPLVPLWIGVIFPVNYFLSKLFEKIFPDPGLLTPITEIKETLFALLFFTVSVWFLLNFPKADRSV